PLRDRRRARGAVVHADAVRVHGLPRCGQPDWRDRQSHHRAVRLHRGEARGRGAARGSAARRRDHASPAGADHGGGDGDRAVPAGGARRPAVGAALLRADRRPDDCHVRHAAARAGDLRDLRARPEDRALEPAGGGARPRMSTRPQHDVEAGRLLDTAAGTADWQRWGTYLSDRAWGTVRAHYSADGNGWAYFPHDHARSRAYRWNEEALAGFCDRNQHLCLGIALWNERDPILKERLFGLSNDEGNHGEDVKEYYFYLDNLPTH